MSMGGADGLYPEFSNNPNTQNKNLQTSKTMKVGQSSDQVSPPLKLISFRGLKSKKF